MGFSLFKIGAFLCGSLSFIFHPFLLQVDPFELQERGVGKTCTCLHRAEVHFLPSEQSEGHCIR